MTSEIMHSKLIFKGEGMSNFFGNVFIKWKIVSFVLILVCLTGQTFAKETSANFTCVKAPNIQPPPALNVQLPEEIIKANEKLKPVCPPGQVPQPVFHKKNQLKGLPPIGTLPDPKLTGTFQYVYAYKYLNCIGSWAYFTQHKPILSPQDYHSIAEIGVLSADTRQIVEIGWTVDRGLNGDDKPHLFVFTWVNTIPNCYNGCGYVQVAANVRPGMEVVSNGSQHVYLIEFYQGNWWFNYDGTWMGYFPESVWTSKGASFNRAGLIEWFGEVAKNTGVMTQMGNGTFGTQPGSASMNKTSLILDPSTSILAGWALGATHLQCYNFASVVQGSDFRYGGPGC